MSLASARAASSMEAQRLPDWKLAYRPDEAAAATGLGLSTLWLRIRQGKIAARKDGGITLITRESLQRYLDELPAARNSK